jgi:hypothetical protein
MDAYSGYNQIPMYHDHKDKIAFMIDNANYTYNVMSFGLKNATETCHKMVNIVFREEICDALEVYIDKMIVKSSHVTPKTLKAIIMQINYIPPEFRCYI